MKHLKQGIAAFLAALLIVPTLPATAEGTTAPATSEADQVWFNTGNLAVNVIDPSVSENEAYQSQCMDLFAEDGSYTINIPEENPFFPYEVQFTCNGETTNEWFMNPEDTVEIGGHTFRVNAYMDGTAVTQMNMNVAGKEVVVYPEEKEFTNDPGEAIAPQSITYDLSTQYLTADLTSFTPVELTQVKIEDLLAGSNVQINTEKIAWTVSVYDDNGNYSIGTKGNTLNLALYSTYGSNMKVTMIVGDANQLAKDDKKYEISIRRTPSKQWLTAEVYREDASGNRSAIAVGETRYNDNYSDKSTRQLSIYYEESNDYDKYSYYLGLKVNSGLFASTNYTDLKVFDGKIADVSQIAGAVEITGQLFSSDMTALNAGLKLKQGSKYYHNDVTLVSYDSVGNVTGCLPIQLSLRSQGISIGWSDLYDLTTRSYIGSYSSYTYDYENNISWQICTLRKRYPANGLYNIKFSCDNMGIKDNSKVTAAYVGNYNSIAEAQAAGARDIKDKLFVDEFTDSYQTDFSSGIIFSFFCGTDDDKNQVVDKKGFQTVENSDAEDNTNSEYELSSNTAVQFLGLVDVNGNQIPAYMVSVKDDSYGEYNYHVIMVAPGTDLSNVAPTFSLSGDTIKLYAEGSSSPEVSGMSYHDLSNGMLQYTASAEDGKASKNYWLKVIQANDDAYPLFVNSLTDKSAKTEYKNGVIYSTREMLVDSYHGNHHDIFLANIGIADLQNVKAELESDTLEIGDYWGLDGTHVLPGYASTSTSNHNNVAKLRIIAKEGVEAGTEIAGKLTISAAGKTLMVLNLTGTIGDPTILTEKVPAAVKYVPYGTMIQNSNKYSWNQVTYYLYSGELPEGMEIKPNGEIYGVPKETGGFTFTVRMRNSGRFSDSTSEAIYTLNVKENTDDNVENATDNGYELKERIMQYIDFSSLPSKAEQLEFAKTHKANMVSKGIFAEYQAVYLDGVKLAEGKDYTAESGSTRITLTYQTLMRSAGTHTLAIEFRETGTNTLKRAAQNYKVNHALGEDGGNSSGDNNSSENDTDSGNSQSTSIVTAGRIQTITYTVQSGDTLSKIAKKYLGDSSLWRKIFEDNKDKIKNPNIIRVGQKLVINLSGTATQTLNPETISYNANTYVVQYGDNLWKIAKKVYGQGLAWKKIYDVNRNIISNPGNIHVGQQLLTP
ncbi:LysM peptidoglycan-binding domain-containing protein [uncultured Eubacterium sp.]|uniref:LysM peptidoglycan-binding domain-containing protein n=1 Tax=uncultured Eubacterium sp. TaxID=165185 RepID=UPI00259370BF|nr:LysM peptidoglycan-binding domain-containing protein [uncultured Eubacterium sp.]